MLFEQERMEVNYIETKQYQIHFAFYPIFWRDLASEATFPEQDLKGKVDRGKNDGGGEGARLTKPGL